MENAEKNREYARQLLAEHIERKKLRKTPERFTILDFIANHNGHFTVDSLHKTLQTSNFHVSLSTLYNTIELLLECNLVTKHHFLNDTAEYERNFNIKTHNHLVCTQCGMVKEFTDINIRRNIQTKHYKNFSLTHYALTVYGLCEKCQKL